MRPAKLAFGSLVLAIVSGSPLAQSSGVFLGDRPVLLAGLDAEEARELKNSGRIMSLEALIAKIREEYPGQIIEIELDDEDDRFIYEIELIDDDGVVIELEIDAATGEVLKYKKDY